MLDFNREIKLTFHKLQESKEKYDVIFTAKEQGYDQVVKFLEQFENVTCSRVM